MLEGTLWRGFCHRCHGSVRRRPPPRARRTATAGSRARPAGDPEVADGLSSTPTKRRPRRRAPTPSEPMPANGDSTVSPGADHRRTHRSMTGSCSGHRWRSSSLSRAWCTERTSVSRMPYQHCEARLSAHSALAWSRASSPPAGQMGRAYSIHSSWVRSVTTGGGVLAGRPEHDDVVGPRLPHGGGVPVELHEQQALGVGADRLGLRVLVDRDLGVVHEPGVDEVADRVAAEVLAAAGAVSDLVGGEVGDVHGDEAAGRMMRSSSLEIQENCSQNSRRCRRCRGRGRSGCRCRSTRTAERTR
jgi:hypothetical protein